jgi:hypothetical protein
VLDRDGAARGQAEVEVRQMDDAEAVELGRKSVERDVDTAQPDPAGLEPAPRERGGRAGEYPDQEGPTAQRRLVKFS